MTECLKLLASKFFGALLIESPELLGALFPLLLAPDQALFSLLLGLELASPKLLGVLLLLSLTLLLLSLKLKLLPAESFLSLLSLVGPEAAPAGAGPGAPLSPAALGAWPAVLAALLPAGPAALRGAAFLAVRPAPSGAAPAAPPSPVGAEKISPWQEPAASRRQWRRQIPQQRRRPYLVKAGVLPAVGPPVSAAGLSPFGRKQQGRQQP